MLDTSLFESLVGRAILAPSSHNTQPWFFRQRGDRIQLLADRTRALPVNDPFDRELTISCGCALFALRVAVAETGRRAAVHLLPDPTDEDLLAEIRMDPEPDPALAVLAGALDQRRTYRKVFAERAVPADLLGALSAAVAEEGAAFAPLLQEDNRTAVAALVAEGDAAQWANPSWRRELAQWMHPRRRGDGLSLPAIAVPAAQLVIRSFDLGNGIAAKDQELAAHSPVLALITTRADTAADWLATGQALQRLLLTACAAGLQGSYLNQPVELPELRQKLAGIGGGSDQPQILLRLGYPAAALPPAPRRAISEVILH